MPLIDLKTDLKSLKYGRDRLGGGSSGQPYIQTNINRPGTNLIGNFDDGLVRGGAVGAAKASIVDTLRIGKFLTDFPKGPLFIVKQVGLQLSNPRLEAKQLRTDNPTRGGGLLRNVGNFIANIANKITNLIGPTRLYNLGINTLAQIPVNAFGGHFDRHGILPIQSDDTKYLAVAQYNNNEQSNRLIGYRNKFELGDLKVNASQDRRVINRINSLFSILGAVTGTKMPSIAVNPAQLTIANYFGGPNSVYGIGNTIIKRYDFTEDGYKITLAKDKQHNKQTIPDVKIQNTFDFGVSTTTKSLLNKNEYQSPAKKLPTDNTSFLNYVASDSDKHSTNTIKQAISYTSASRNIENFLGLSNNSNSKYGLGTFSVLSKIPATLDEKDPLQYALNSVSASHAVSASNDLGLSKLDNEIPTESISRENNVISYTTPTLKKYAELRKKVDATSTISQNFAPFKENIFAGTFTTAKSFGKGKINALALAKVYFNRDNDKNINDDTLALIFNPLDPFTGTSLKTLKFLGYITDYTENYDSGWGDVKYAGRAESFYTFNSFKRALTVGFNIPCYNKEELVEKHCALSELASSLAGSYKNDFLLGGIITRLKLGGYIDNQPGIITNLTFNPIQDSSWDLDEGLAFYLKVSFGFTVIHNFLPQFYKDCGFLKDPPPYKEDNTKTIQNIDPVITPTISNVPIFSQTSIIDSTFKRKADQLRNGESLREIFLNDRGLPPDSFIEKIPPPPDSSKLLGKNYYNIPGRG